MHTHCCLLLQLCDTFRAGELSVVATTHEFRHRPRCYELLADALI